MDTNNNTYNDLLRSIDHWNEYRVPILRISQPDRNLIFRGAMRFYFQDAGQKVSTKCVNVSSSDTTKEVIDVLIEKFRPDMRMLSVPEYGLYEIHENGDERKLELDERPLYVQLQWNKDDREGRFLLRRMDEKTKDFAPSNEEPSLKRKLSKKEKKKQEKIKKQQIKEQEKADAAAIKLAAKNGIAERLYNELPETSFTRSISNPEAVMKRRRAQKLEKRLQEFSLEGGQEAGGTLRIFGETINRDVSYKTLLLSTKDTASFVVKQILEKYGKDDEDPTNYCLVQLIVPNSATSADNSSVNDLNTSAIGLRESILEDTDCPLLINQNHDRSKGVLTFHIRHKPADYQKRRKKKPPRSQSQQNSLHPLVVQQLNQRLQVNNINNNSEPHSNQNSPQNSSQTSGSLHHDSINPPPPPFETVHSMPTMFPMAYNNGNMMPYQQHSVSAATLPSASRMTASNHQQPPPQQQQHHHHQQQQLNSMHESNGTLLHHQNYSQPNPQAKQFIQNPIHNNLFTMAQQQHMQQHAPVNQQSYTPITGASDHILPALIQVKEDVEDIFLNRVITHLDPNGTAFRLAPTYVLYMVSRYRASTLFHPELHAPKRAELFVPFTKKIATMIRNTIEIHLKDPDYLTFWLANSSDLSHFYKQDKHLSHFTIDAQAILYDSIRTSFRYLLSCRQRELDSVLNDFFSDQDDQEMLTNFVISGQSVDNLINTSIYRVLKVLDKNMAIMRKNRVNTALTIQIFAHLLHHISKWLFDRLIGVHDPQPNSMMNGSQHNFAIYCNRIWGERLNLRLATIVKWTETRGLEQAANFHLARVTQATAFLARRYPPTIRPSEFEESINAYDRLNVVQLRALLQRYQPELPSLRAIIENFLYTMDYSYMACEYPLEEDFELKIPFLIPEDGYSSEMIRYIPETLLDFVSQLSKIRIRNQELCIFTVQPTSTGYWTVYFKNIQPDAPEVIVIQLRKKNNSMGLSIIAARGVGQERLGIYIKNVVKNGAAALDGRLQAGDQLMEVDGNSLIDISQETAAELMQRTGPIVTLRIAKQAAIYHNLSDIINSVPSQTIVSTPSIVMHPSVIPPPPIEPHQIPAQYQAPPMHHTVHSQLLNRHGEPQETRAPVSANPISPLKSPKKVSWVDTQPHQSLHTLIPPSPAANGHLDAASDSPTPEESPPPPPTNGQTDTTIESPTIEDVPPSPPTNGQLETTTESLTLEDIDEVLSSKTHNNWLEDSAGVIGTQEVYNDPRQRIVKERERPNDTDVNIEKLSFQEKLKMFNISAKK